MSVITAPSLDGVSTQRLVEEIEQRGEFAFALRLIRERMPWWRRRFQISDKIWGLSSRWFCVCPWNGNTAWITLPFVYFGVGTMNVELRLGSYQYAVAFDIRWRWE